MVVKLCYDYWYPDSTITDTEKKYFEKVSDKILSDHLSWKTYLCRDGSVIDIEIIRHYDGCKCTRISRNDCNVYPGCHMKITLVSNNYLTTHACPGLEDDVYTLSCTRVPSMADVSEVFINKTNWDKGFEDVFADIKYSQHKKDANELYYKYVIYHEVGHALGRVHYIPRNTDSQKKNNKFPAPIMMQQTKGLFGYEINVHPLKQEQGLFCEIRECEHENTCKEFLIPI